MPASILVTKLYIPPLRSKAVLRPRLITQLNEDLQRKLTLVSAPAGFGKTSLISEWVADCERPVAWLSLDELDSDLTRFLTYFIASLQTVTANIGDGILSALQSPQPPSNESIYTTLLNEIASVADDFILVLDDYHMVDSQLVDQAVGFLLENSPAQMHLVMTTREDPLLPLARLRARSQMTEIRATDLRFTHDESADFLNQTMGLNLTAKDITALESRTEGWIVGLQLAAISLQGREDSADFIKSFTGSHYFVLDYLLEEVLQQQPEEVQTFLLNTVILDRLSGSLCDAVLNDASVSGGEILQYLRRTNLFLIPLDDRREWYRYHHLFADVVHARLKKQQPGLIVALHQRASEWYEANGRRADAIKHSLIAEDFTRAAELIELAWPEMDRYIQSAPWLGWVKALPEELVCKRPVLLTSYALALIDIGELEVGGTQLGIVEECLGLSAESNLPLQIPTGMIVVDKVQFRRLPLTLASARAYLSQAIGDLPDAIRYGEKALSLLPVEDQLRRGSTAVMLALTYCSAGELDSAYQTIVGGMTEIKNAGHQKDTVGGVFILADIRIVQGRLYEARSLIEKNLQLVIGDDPLPQGAAYLYLVLSGLYREWGNHELAEQHLQRCEAINKEMPLQLCQYRLTLLRARLLEDQGDIDGSLESLRFAEQLYYRSVVPEFRSVGALMARVLITQGRLSEALAWAREQALSVDNELAFLNEFEHITFAKLLVAQYKKNRQENEITEVLEFINRLIASAEKGGRKGSVIELLILCALARQVHGETSLALESLNNALTLAEPEAYVRIFVDEGAPMNQLLSLALEDGNMPDYINKLLAEFEKDSLSTEDTSSLASESQVAKSADSSVQTLFEPLSERELRVLELIDQGLSNREISQRIHLALDTIKGHNRRIFAKLGAQRRTEAVAKAKLLKII